MIRLTRQRNTTAIPAAFRGDGRVGRERTLLAAKRDHFKRLLTDPKAGHGFKSSWWKASKKQLRTEASGKCAYCEARADATSVCDVEHFRPKDTWWWLACCWDNFLFSCQICNQQYKNNEFPFDGKQIPVPELQADSPDADLDLLKGTLGPDPMDDAGVSAFLAATGLEGAEFLDPYNENPEDFLAYEADDVLGEVKVKSCSSNPARKRRVDSTIKGYGLNREELRQLRYEMYKGLALAKETLDLPTTSAAQRQNILNSLKRFIQPKRSFSGMSRYFIVIQWHLLA